MNSQVPEHIKADNSDDEGGMGGIGEMKCKMCREILSITTEIDC